MSAWSPRANQSWRLGALACVWVLFAGSGCDQKTGVGAQPTATAKTSAEPTATAAPATSASASSSAAAAMPYAGRWKGSYKATKAEVRVPKGVRYDVWEKDDGKQWVGAGSLDLVVDAKGMVRGSSTGALGALTVAGRIDDGKLRAALQPKDPTAEPGMSGVLTGEASKDTLGAKLRVSNHDATIVRGSTVELARE
jgi:hypothetical protein